MQQHPTPKDFSFIKVIGKGCAGKVLLVRSNLTGELFALKSIHKRWVLENNQLSHLRQERNILANVASSTDHLDGTDFLIQLHASFQTKDDLFYLLDYHPGGDLASLLARQFRLPETTVVYYAAEMALALLALHKRRIVYRDLKPENILFDRRGDMVLTDFGLSKCLDIGIDGTLLPTWTFCGTAEYLAPEILAGQSYGLAVDWWSYGTVLYEMFVGTTPFWAEDHGMMYQRILSETRINLPDALLSPAAKDLILKVKKFYVATAPQPQHTDLL